MPKKYTLPDLPYKYEALEPYISREIMMLHHDKHHLAYVNGANAALEKLEAGRKNNWQGVDIKGIERDLSFNLAGHVLHKHEAQWWRETRRAAFRHDRSRLWLLRQLQVPVQQCGEDSGRIWLGATCV